MMRSTLLIGLLMFQGCGDDPDRRVFDPYEAENVAVIGDGAITLSGPVGSGDCVQVSQSLCVPVISDSTWCERDGGPVDVVVVDGVAVEVICYPPSDDPTRPTLVIDETTRGDIEVVQSANNTTIVFDESLDAVLFEGDLTVDGNNVAIYGNGPERTIIDGDVVIAGNNVRLRGVTITGSLSITLNNAAVVLSRIHGDVRIAKNGTVFVENTVYGGFESSSNGNVLVGNDVQGAWTASGNDLSCDENNAFADGEPLICP